MSNIFLCRDFVRVLLYAWGVPRNGSKLLEVEGDLYHCTWG